MAKQFKIYFSKTKKKVSEIFDPEIGVEKVTVRRTEIELLTTIFKYAARFSPDPGNSMECRDVVEQIGNIKKTEHSVELTKDDLKHSKDGYGRIGGKISYDTIDHCHSLLSQLDSPFDPDEDVKWDDKLEKYKEAK